MTYEPIKVPAFTLLLGAYGVALVVAMRGRGGLYAASERLVCGFLAITFCAPFLSLIDGLGMDLTTFIRRLGDTEPLSDFIAQALYSAANKFQTGSPMDSADNLISYLSQIFRSGVWGILASITELIFVMAAFIVQVGKEGLWEILLILFPFGAALFPISPRPAINMALFSIELALWLPILEIINIATSRVARRYSLDAGDVGFRILALEIVAIGLTFSIGMVARKLVSGSLSGDMLDSWKSVFSAGSTLVMGIPKAASYALTSAKLATKPTGLSVAVTLLGVTLTSVKAEASPTIVLKAGFLKKISCKGRLYAHGVGDEGIVELEPLPFNLGCGAILRPVKAGSTNMILETSTGTLERTLVVRATPKLSKLPPKEAK